VPDSRSARPRTRGPPTTPAARRGRASPGTARLAAPQVPRRFGRAIPRPAARRTQHRIRRRALPEPRHEKAHRRTRPNPTRRGRTAVPRESCALPHRRAREPRLRESGGSASGEPSPSASAGRGSSLSETSRSELGQPSLARRSASCSCRVPIRTGTVIPGSPAVGRRRPAARWMPPRRGRPRWRGHATRRGRQRCRPRDRSTIRPGPTSRCPRPRSTG